ncbi:cytosine permease [Pseudomonas putida]|uniref:Cytosine permease n=1 Tax=Pseudomonas putida TaxID=303 RepID=A0A7W2KZ07_PSEPU|nr:MULTISPECIES: cytosine permease [Pseudomonas]MBA6115312.1 cytosine permease [Pseudomonas putida]MBI6939927.1 cytosine permease [Pseudomonas putida]MBI6956103.1 cytosine permease [Pseudomonas putida]MCZ9639494.1 cytosine permease [Pseudomonas putida]MEC4878103.1 cytosine permease [Pseudomonas sp. NC26]
MSSPRDSASKGRINLETRSIDYVPLAERHGKAWHLWPIWFCGEAHLTTLAVGIIGVGMGANLFWSAVAIFLGCAFGTLFMAGHSTQGPQMGLPQLIQSRPQFGYLGALLVYVVAIATYVGYNAFNQVLVGQTLHELFNAPESGSAIAFSLLAIIMAIAGYNTFHKVQRVLAFVLIGVMLVFTVGLFMFVKLPADQLTVSGFKATPFLAQFFVAAAYQLSWAIYVSDYSRYLPPNVSVRSSFWWTYLGAMIGGVWMMLIGALAAAMSPGQNLAKGLVMLGNLLFSGFGEVLLILAVLSLLTSAAQNFYGASITLLSIADTIKSQTSTLLKRVVAMLIVGGTAILIAMTASDNFVKDFGDFLAILLYLFTPWTAINLVDFYKVRHGQFSIKEIFKPNGIYGKWNLRGIGAYFAGFVAMLPFSNTGLYTGYVAQQLDGADISMVVGLIVSALVYGWLCRSQDIQAELTQVPLLDRGLENGV